jgi:FkbM family methyltransferase
MDVRDGVVRRVVWTLPHQVERRVGADAARRVARMVGSFEGRSDSGVLRIARRISPRLADENPGLTKISPAWQKTALEVRRHGLRLELDLRDNLQAVLYYAGRYEPALRRFLRYELKPDDVVLDAGANIGLHSLLAAKELKTLGGGRVIAFEPAADCLGKLRRAAELNGLSDLIEIVPAALGEWKQQAELHADSRYDLADAGVRSLYGDGQVIQRVPVIRLDDWVREHSLDRLDIVKLDIEGSESAALAGATRTLQRLQPRAVLVEDKRADQRPRLYDVLDGLGYRHSGRVFDNNALFRPDRRALRVVNGRNTDR